MGAALFATLAMTVSAPAQSVDTSDADAVAHAILTGYKAQDAAMIAPHSNDTNQRFFNELLSGAEDPSELFEGTRGAAGTGWNGNVLPARFEDGRHGFGQAIIPFAYEKADGIMSLSDIPTDEETLFFDPGRYVAIVLTLDSATDTSWGFEDINYIATYTYDEMAGTR
jgi:hypothetical protein